ncbi:MAG TPA: hypothetical protein VMU51_37030 [Mycobacteriales bacterium]|nr:hypothetical protein [Mycobacteriales bacterium]
MRAGLCRAAVGAALAVAIAVGGTAQPAQAAFPGNVTLPPAGPFVNLAFAAYKLIDGSLSPSDVERLLLTMIAASNQAGSEMISHIDAHVAARAVGEARGLTIRFQNYQNMRQTWELFFFAGDAVGAASIDRTEFNATTDRKAADAIGTALNVVYPMARTAVHDAGYAQTAQDTLKRDYIQALEAIVARLEPVCTSTVAPDTPAFINEVRYECVAANGERVSDYQVRNVLTGKWLRGPVNVDQLKVDSAIHSSWLTAGAILPTLRTP